jgi:DNA-binding SARP family transcriptional activator
MVIHSDMILQGEQARRPRSKAYSRYVGSTLTLSLLGRFAVAIDDRELPTPAVPHRPAAAVVKLLALAPAHRLPPDVLIEQLWPEIPADRGAANLRKAVHFARRALGSEQTIDTRANTVGLWPSASVVVDAARFEATARAALATDDPRIGAEAAELYSGELLPDDRYASWADAPRERLRALALAVYKVARQWEQALEIDPLDEEAHRGRMRDQLEGGNRQAAIQQFERLRAALRDELGASPDPQTVAVYEAVLASERPEAPTPAQRARALLAWGMVHWERRELDEADRTAREARALAVDAGLGGEVGEASALIGMIAHARGRWREFFRDELLGSLRQTPHLAPFVFDANLCLSEFCLYLPGGLPEMASFADDLGRTAEDAGSAQGHALATLMRGEVELLSGHLTHSEVSLTEAAEPHPAEGADSATPLALERLAEAWTWAGQPWKARRILRRALRLAGSGPLATHLVVRVYGAMVESAATAADAAEVVSVAERAMAGVDVCQPCSIGFHLAAARRLAEGSDVQAASSQLEAAEQIAAMWQGGPWAAEVREARALIVRGRGEVDEAAMLLGEAAALYADAGFTLHAARCRAAIEAA